jgi:hypothetical protein
MEGVVEEIGRGLLQDATSASEGGTVKSYEYFQNVRRFMCETVALKLKVTFATTDMRFDIGSSGGFLSTRQ